MDVASVEGEGLDENARQAFPDLLTRITSLIEEALYSLIFVSSEGEGVERIDRCSLPVADRSLTRRTAIIRQKAGAILLVGFVV